MSANGAHVTYKKQPGTLRLTASTLEWAPQTSSSPALSLPTAALSALFASKPGGPRVMLKVVGAAPDDSHNFTFVSPTNPLGDRDWFKDHLSQRIATNRERDAQQASVQAQAAATATPAPQAPAPAAAPALTSTQATTFRLRKLVLQADPSLLQLHRDLVLTGEITETEFWAGRQDLVDAVAAEQGLVKGKSGEMVDPKTVTGQNGEVTVKITPALIRDIFEEFPVVLRAYNDNVPDPVRSFSSSLPPPNHRLHIPVTPQLDEAQFWTRYFQSKLFNRNRTTNRAAVDAIKDDPIFDKYLGEEDDGAQQDRSLQGALY